MTLTAKLAVTWKRSTLRTYLASALTQKLSWKTTSPFEGFSSPASSIGTIHCAPSLAGTSAWSPCSERAPTEFSLLPSLMKVLLLLLLSPLLLLLSPLLLPPSPPLLLLLLLLSPLLLLLLLLPPLLLPSPMVKSGVVQLCGSGLSSNIWVISLTFVL